MASARVPHFSLPFRFDPYIDQGGELRYEAAVNEQGTDDEVADCIEAIVRYPVGYRLEKPEFGTPDQVFKSPTPDTGEVRTAVERWEPRTLTSVNTNTTEFDVLLHELSIEMRRRDA